MSFWSKRVKRHAATGSLGAQSVQADGEAGEANDAAEAAAVEANRRAEREAELAKLQGEFSDMPTFLRNTYTSDAQRAGTYSKTGDFDRGMQSEVDAGLPGAYATNMRRQNALQGELGLAITPYDTSAAEAPTATPAVAMPGAAPAQGAAPQALNADSESTQTEDPTVATADTQRQKALRQKAVL